MNKKSSEFIKKHKKALLIVAVIVLLLLLLLLVFQNLKTPAANSENQSGSVINNQRSAVTPSPVAFQGEVYNAPRYSIKYPEGWKPMHDVFDGGAFFVVHPDGYRNDPLIAVESYDGATDYRGKALNYERMGFTSSPFQFGSLQGTKVSGTWNMRVIDGKPIIVPTQETILFLPQPDSLYVIKYYYNGNQPDPASEELMRNILSTFQLRY